MYKILITGADGFIGKNLSKELIEANHLIIKLSRKYKYKGKAIGDFNEFNQWDELLADVDIVIHLAGYVHKNEKSHTKIRNNNHTSNYILTKNLFDASLNTNIKQFIFLSTVGVHGQRANSRLISEESKANPYSDYTSSKLLSEKYIIDTSHGYDLKYTIIRPPIVYGKYSPGNINTLLNFISYGIPLPFGNIKNKRSFIGIDNLTDFINFIVMNKKSFNEVFIVSDNQTLATSEFIEKIIIAKNSKSYLFFIPKICIKIIFKIIKKNNLYNSLFNSFEVNIDKSINILNWKPKFSPDFQIQKFFKKIKK